MSGLKLENSINTQKNSIVIKFERDHSHKLSANYLFTAIDFKSNFGRFSGRILTEDGHDISFKDVFGFFEDFHARW